MEDIEKVILLAFTVAFGVVFYAGYSVIVFPYLDDPNATYYTGILIDVEFNDFSFPTLYFEDGKVIKLSNRVNDLVIGQKYVVTHQYNKWTNINESD